MIYLHRYFYHSTSEQGRSFSEKRMGDIGDESIEEVNEYKYLGYFVNRTLKSNFHICNFLKEKADKQLNYMIFFWQIGAKFTKLLMLFKLQQRVKMLYIIKNLIEGYMMFNEDIRSKKSLQQKKYTINK
jgi:hypothetical protein